MIGGEVTSDGMGVLIVVCIGLVDGSCGNGSEAGVDVVLFSEDEVGGLDGMSLDWLG